MIVSHEHRYIFIKTQKTAGTSIELALSKFCGENDVITPVSPDDETLRRELGGRGPQNFERGFRDYRLKDWARLAIKQRKAYPYRNHLSARAIRAMLPRRIWSSYYKVCVERNPWDKVLSAYYWTIAWKAKRGETGPNLQDYLASERWYQFSEWDGYTDRHGIIVDRVIRYENLDQELFEVTTQLGLPKLELPRAKGGHRSDRRPYWEVIGFAERQRIAGRFRNEITHFGYTFGESASATLV